MASPKNLLPDRASSAKLSWSAKRIKLPRSCFWTLPLFMLASFLPVGILVWYLSEDLNDWMMTVSLSIGMLALLLVGAFRKSHFHYRIHLERAEVNYQLCVPRYMEDFVKGMALIVIVALLGLAVFLGSAVLLGPVAMVIIAALRLLSWEPPPAVHETSLPWHNYQHVTIDRYFLIIAVHVDEEQCGFVARLPNKELFEQYLAFLRTVLPPTVQYREGIWWG
ncbi:hypothetical protein RRX38_00780 [Pseudomonas sp. DTU_2021_1001937_2_SI_NGA_ILE_001]|uniref:hypothetical protein n=1 Tax=Pseudomonas sp. DTU_2021_1001937_2_SI_NGA_ILE_001 TaxID=3077589 RepID=UPI0028FC1E90|nr:hypothetical protein [Pseudomonas sp. DTU_2021_1001937_2_SI_NGA_ILE_001]WNW09738.1 hypothetical protein RRX38_00780 [Pseudomonas sp. DTU_2021_1001937_2_SI_NGA_ILE_001]